MRRSRIFMTLRNQISAAAGIPQKRSTAISRKPMIRHPHSRDSVSVGFRTADEILCPLTSANTPDKLRCEAFEQALTCFKDRRWSTAEQRFEALLNEFPGDGPARFMLGVCPQGSQVSPHFEEY